MSSFVGEAKNGYDFPQGNSHPIGVIGINVI
jgi:hypothetical protein